MAVPRLTAQVVRRPQDPRLSVEVGVDLAVTVGVIAECDHVDPGREQLVGDLRRDPEPAGNVLAVDDDERRVVALAQHRQQRQQRATAGRTDEIAAEEDSGSRGHPASLTARDRTRFPKQTARRAILPRDEHRAGARQRAPPWTQPRRTALPPAPPAPLVIPHGVQLVLLALGLLGLWVAARAARSVVEIIIVASFIALMLNPFVSFLGRRGIPRGLAIPLTYLSLLLLARRHRRRARAADLQPGRRLPAQRPAPRHARPTSASHSVQHFFNHHGIHIQLQEAGPDRAARRSRRRC